MRTVRAGTLALGATLVLGAAAPAAAVTGGAPDDGPLMRASVMVLGSNGGVCSAVVVAPDAVLTAAHCATGAAEHRVHYKEPSGEPVLLVPAAAAVHPGYDAGAIAARRRSIDLALVRLVGPLPSRFAPASLSAAAPAKDASLTLGGWGVSVEGEPRTTGTFRTAALRAVEPHGPSRILVWARGATGASGAAGSGACRGDSGGPIATGAGVVAVSTWATGAGARSCGALSQGVLLGPQREWIDRVLAGWGRAARWE